MSRVFLAIILLLHHHGALVCFANVSQSTVDSANVWTSNSSNNIPISLDNLKHSETGVPYILSQRLLNFSPPFAPIHSENEACRNDSVAYIQALQRFEMWALKMYDATAKIPSGLLSGNMNQYGDFDSCMSADGQYCLAYVDLKLAGTESETLHTVHTLMHSHHAFRSTLKDPGHRVPRFSTLHWAVCVPKSCSPGDVEFALDSVAQSATSGTGFKARVTIHPEMCQISSSGQPLSVSTKFVGALFLLLFGVIAMATTVDVILDKKPPSSSLDVLLCFSLKKNLKKLLSTDTGADEISSVHGIRFMNAIMLYLSHKSMAAHYNPYVNRTGMAELLGRPWTVLARAASLYTDPFIMMSGLLTTYSLSKQMIKDQKINVGKEIVSRVMRLTPTLGALILFCTFILPFTSSGPQWPLVINKHAEICKVNWWKNILFIHNLFGFRDLCLTHTHHVGIDTQLFLMSPLLVYLLYKYPKQGLFTLLGIGVTSTVLRFYVSYVRQLNLYVYFGNSVSQMYNTADYSYILPTHRATVYVMGIGLGYLLRQWGRDVKLKNSQLTLGWFIAFCMLYQSYIHPSKMGDRFYVYDRLDAANYAAFAPITWCMFFAWIIFTSHTGNGGLFTRMAEYKYWQICTRLSYTFYLTQFPVFFYNVGRTRHSDWYTINIIFDIKEFVVCVFVSAVLTLSVEMPFQNIRNLFLKKSTPSTPTNGVAPSKSTTMTANSDKIKAS